MTARTRMETERLLLRPFRLSDIPEIQARFDADPEVKRYTGGLCATR